MFCEQCGTKLPDGSLFCENCGAKLSVAEDMQYSAPSAEAVEAAEVVEAAEAVEQAVQAKTPAQTSAQQPFIPFGTNPAQQSTMPSIKIPFQAVIIAVEVIAIIGAIVGMHDYIGKQFEPEKVAEKYFVSMANADVEEAYGILGFKEDEFVNANSYKTYLATQNDMSNMTNYVLAKDSYDYFGVENEDVASEAIVKDIGFRYTTSNSNEEFTSIVRVMKDAGKRFGMYDNWKVVSNDAIAENTTVIVKKGATVVVDGVTLNESYITTEIDTDYYDLANYDAYRIPQVFKGMHQFNVSVDGYQSIVEGREIYNSESTHELFYMQMTQEKVTELESMVADNIKNIYQAALNNQSFESLSVAFAQDNLDGTRNEYNYLVDYFNGGDNKVQSVEFSNFKVESSTDNLSMEISFDYVIKYKNYEGKNKTENDSFHGYTNLVMQDGSYVQSSLGAGTLTYLGWW